MYNNVYLGMDTLLICSLFFNETCSSFFADTANVTDFVLKSHAVEFVGIFQEFWAKGRCDKLSIVSKAVNHGYREKLENTCKDITIHVLENTGKVY